MKADCGQYPRLGQFFDSTAQIAAAACMTRPTLYQVIQGTRQFTDNEKAAIKNAVLAKVLQGTAANITVNDLLTGEFDELFKIKE